MKITLEMHDAKYTYESNSDEYTANEMKEIFSRMLVQATYSPSVIDLSDGGHYECEYKEDECQ